MPPKPKIQLPTGFLSPSQMEMYFRCPKQYEFRYILGIKSPPGVFLTDGGCHHETLEDNNKYKIKTGKDRSVQHLVQKFCDTFNDQAKKIPRSEWKLADTTKDKIINRGKLIQVQYHKYFAPNLNPLFCEHEMRYKVGGIEVLGYIDVVGVYAGREKVSGAFDYKVTDRLKSNSELGSSVALSHYGWGAVDLLKQCSLDINPPHVGYCILKRTGDSKPVFQSIPLTVQRIKWYRRQVLTVAEAISRGSFPVCSGSGWECSPRWCGYFSRCRSKVQGK